MTKLENSEKKVIWKEKIWDKRWKADLIEYDDGSSKLVIVVPGDTYDKIQKEADNENMSVDDLMKETLICFLDVLEEQRYKRWRRNVINTSRRTRY
jgi:hypothetical protein